MINRDRIVKTFCELVQIDSPSGEEEEMAVDMVRRLEALGLSTVRDSYGNLIANMGQPADLILSAHLDTVEPGRGIKPIVEGDRIVSDGTTIVGGDCKAAIAVILETLESMKEDGTPHINYEVVLTREEETGLMGARNLDFSLITGKEAIIFDGEGPVSTITSASPTYIGFEVDITGRAAHAGIEPEKGISAIRIAAEIITRLPQGRLDGETTFNIGAIEGGSVRNAVPEKTLVTGEYRSTSVETLDSLSIQISDVVKEVQALYPEAVIEENQHSEFETYRITEDDVTLQRIKKAMQSLGLEPTMVSSGGGTDGNIFRKNL